MQKMKQNNVDKYNTWHGHMHGDTDDASLNVISYN